MAGSGFQTTGNSSGGSGSGVVKIRDWFTTDEAGVNTDHRLLVDKNAPYAIRIDDTLLNTIYIGKAVVGTADADPKWQLKKVDTTTGTSITWASGDYKFDKIWNNRGTYIYS